MHNGLLRLTAVCFLYPTFHIVKATEVNVILKDTYFRLRAITFSNGLEEKYIVTGTHFTPFLIKSFIYLEQAAVESDTVKHVVEV